MAQLQRFVCTDPPRRVYQPGFGSRHPRPWELDVQAHLRDLRLPLSQSENLLLCIADNDDVAAACHYGFDDEGKDFIIFALAVAADRTNRGLGQSILSLALGTIRQTAEQQPERAWSTIARIDHRNGPSRALFQRMKFERIRDAVDDLELWEFVIERPGAV